MGGHSTAQFSKRQVELVLAHLHLGEEQWSFIDSRPAEWVALPMPNGPLTVGIDGGYVKA
jgi:hypothetical protein